MYLLDTNVISEFRKISMGRGDRQVAKWATSVEASILYLSSICVLEIDTGIRLLGRKDKDAAGNIRRWLDDYVLVGFSGRIISFDVPAARVCAKLMAERTRPYRDALIAATAIECGMTLVTRNTKDFDDMGLSILNPWTFEGD